MIAESKLIVHKAIDPASTKKCALAQHYGFTTEERDFAIKYNIKHCMGRDSSEEQRFEINGV